MSSFGENKDSNTQFNTSGTTPYPIYGLEQTPRILPRLITAVTWEALDRPTGPDRFSPREVVAHLADCEPIFRERILTALRQDGGWVPSFSEEDRAVAQRYHEWPVEKSVEQFAHERAETTRLLRGLARREWSRGFVHEERGSMTVLDQVAMMLGHDLYHLEQLTGLAAEPSVGAVTPTSG